MTTGPVVPGQEMGRAVRASSGASWAMPSAQLNPEAEHGPVSAEACS